MVLMILLCSYSIGLHRAVKEKQNEKISHRKNRLVCHSKRNLSARNQNISIIDYKTYKRVGLISQRKISPSSTSTTVI